MTREEVIAMAQSVGLTGLGERNVIALERLTEIVEARVAAREREACAKVCDKYAEGGIGGWKHNTPTECAAAIRSRSTD